MDGMTLPSRLTPDDAQQIDVARERLLSQAELKTRPKEDEILRKALGKASAGRYLKIVRDAAYAQGALDGLALGSPEHGERLILLERQVKDLQARLDSADDTHRKAMERQTAQHRKTIENYSLRLANKDEEIKQLRFAAPVRRPEPTSEPEGPTEPETPTAPARARRRVTTS